MLTKKRYVLESYDGFPFLLVQTTAEKEVITQLWAKAYKNSIESRENDDPAFHMKKVAVEAGVHVVILPFTSIELD